MIDLFFIVILGSKNRSEDAFWMQILTKANSFVFSHSFLHSLQCDSNINKGSKFKMTTNDYRQPTQVFSILLSLIVLKSKATCASIAGGKKQGKEIRNDVALKLIWQQDLLYAPIYYTAYTQRLGIWKTEWTQKHASKWMPPRQTQTVDSCIFRGFYQ